MLVDTNVILAAADDADPDHVRCKSLLEGHPGPLVTTPLVVAESGWLIDHQLGAAAEASFYRSIAKGDLAVEEATSADWQRIAELVDAYADLGLGGVDASIVAMAARAKKAALREPEGVDAEAVVATYADCPDHDDQTTQAYIAGVLNRSRRPLRRP